MSHPRRKSITMFERLKELKWQFTEDKDSKYLRISSKQAFAICDGSFKDWSKPFVSLGEEPEKREIIFVDPDSDSVKACYATLKTKIQQGHIESIASAVMATAEEIFDPTNVESFCSTWPGERYNDVPVIPLDDFIKTNTGNCRHRVLLQNILFYKLKQEGLIDDCDIFLLRGVMTSGEGHACTVLVPKNMSPANALFVDANLHDKPYWIYGDEDELDTNLVKLCKERYLTPSVDFFRQLNPANVSFRFYAKEKKVIYRDPDETKVADKVKVTHIVHDEVGSGSYGTVYQAESVIQPTQYIAIKRAIITTEYDIDIPDEIITHEVMRSNEVIARELPFTRQINGKGAVFCTNDPIHIEVENGKKVLKSYPCVSLAMEWIEGKLFSEYEIKSTEHFCKAAIALCKPVRTFHVRDKIVLEDIHAKNVKMIEDKDGNITARYFDHSLSQHYNQFLSLYDLYLIIKPKYFAGKKVIKSHYADDIYCLGLMLQERYKSTGFDIPPPIQAILSLMLEANPEAAITLDEVIKSFEDLLNKRSDPFELNLRINSQHKDVRLPLFVMKFNLMANKTDRATFLKLIGFHFFKHYDKDTFLLQVSALDKHQAHELLIFLVKTEREEQAKLFPTADAINKWCYFENLLQDIRATEPSEDHTEYFSKFKFIKRDDLKPHVKQQIFIGATLINTLKKIDIQHRFTFLMHLITINIHFFNNILTADQHERISNLTHNKINPKRLLQLMVRNKQNSLEGDSDTKEIPRDNLDKWLFCETILHALDNPTCNLKTQFIRLCIIRCDASAVYFQKHPDKIISTLKKPFSAEKIKLLKLMRIELIGLSLTDLTHIYHLLPHNQQQEFIDFYRPSRKAIIYIVSDREGYGCDPVYLREKQQLAMMLTEDERHLAYTHLLRNMSVKLQAQYKASGDEEAQALLFDKCLYIESILSDPNNRIKTAAAIEKLSSAWDIGHGVPEFNRSIYTSNIHSLVQMLYMPFPANKIFVLQLIETKQLKKLLANSDHINRVFRRLQDFEKVEVLKQLGLEHVKSIADLAPGIAQYAEEAFGREYSMDPRHRLTR